MVVLGGLAVFNERGNPVWFRCQASGSGVRGSGCEVWRFGIKSLGVRVLGFGSRT